MRASYVVILAWLIYTAGRWAHNQPAFSIASIAAMAFTVAVIAALDNGRTEHIAKGIAWLLLAGAVLAKDSPVTALASLINSKLTTQTTPSGIPGHQLPSVTG